MKKNHICLLIVLLSYWTIPATFAADQNKAWDDPAKAAAEDPDFLVQGEYANKNWGVQVIALGGRKFEAYLLEGGLPGEGWDKTKKRTRFEGKTEEGGTRCSGPDGQTMEIKGSTLSLAGATLKKQERKSPTVGAKPPKSAIVLFDSTKESLANFENGARITEDGLLMQGVNSKQKFGDHSVHIEFRLPYQPTSRGQGRGNSGMYLQGRHEVQMLDSFGLEGKNNECGGIYTVRDPDVNMCFPPLTWQTYDVDYTAARYDADGKKIANAKMTVRHNGVIVQKDVEVGKATTSAPKGDSQENGPLHLQDHGNPVRYRNIWIVEKK